MSIATLRFNLPEDKTEFDLAIKGPKLRNVLDEWYNQTRAIVKYGTDSRVREHMSEESTLTIEQICEVTEILRHMMVQIERDYNTLDDL